MPNLDDKTLDDLEKVYPGIKGNIRGIEEAKLPPCPYCKSENTALVQHGIIGRSINVAAATGKIHLSPGAPEKYFCNYCKKYFN
jgi:hypothetical protein